MTHSQIFSLLQTLISKETKLPLDRLHSSTNLSSLNLDSLTLSNLILSIEESFCIDIPQGLNTLQEITNHIKLELFNTPPVQLRTILHHCQDLIKQNRAHPGLHTTIQTIQTIFLLLPTNSDNQWDTTHFHNHPALEELEHLAYTIIEHWSPYLTNLPSEKSVSPASPP